MERKKLLLLNPSEYEHEFDLKALKTLEGTPGLEKLARQINKHGIERAERLKQTGSHLRVNKDNFPEIYELLEEACQLLFVKDIPDLYIMWDYNVNGFTTGSENPLIVIHSGSLDLLSKDELLWLIAHEVGHIKSGHMLYHMMAQVIPIIGAIIGSATLGIGSLVSTGLEIALIYWYRMSEFTADRAGLLACQDINVAISTLMKMSGVPKHYYDNMKTEDFIEQAKEFKGFDYDTVDKVAKALIIMDKTHPWTVMRASELLKWHGSGKYDELIEKHGKDSIEELDLCCVKCGHKLKGNETFCGVCGEKVWKR